MALLGSDISLELLEDLHASVSLLFGLFKLAVEALQRLTGLLEVLLELVGLAQEVLSPLPLGLQRGLGNLQGFLLIQALLSLEVQVLLLPLEMASSLGQAVLKGRFDLA